MKKTNVDRGLLGDEHVEFSSGDLAVTNLARFVRWTNSAGWCDLKPTVEELGKILANYILVSTYVREEKGASDGE